MNTETSPMTAAGLNLPRDLTRRDWLKLCALLLALISAPAAPMLAATDDEIPVVDPFFMLSGALLKDGFDGPQLDATLWSRPSWLVENHKTIGVTIENGHLVLPGGRQAIGGDASVPAAVAMIRPETIHVVESGSAPLAGVIDSVSFIGDRQRLVVSGVSGKPLTIDAPNTVQAKAGERIGLLIAPDAVRLLPPED